MATITTTTNGNPVIYPGNTLIDRSPVTGYLYVMVKASTADTYQLFRSTDNGGSWGLYLSVVRTNVQELGSLRCLRYPYDQLVWCYRTSESSQDRIYLRTIHDLGAASPAWNPEVLVSAVANGGTPGLVYSGMDIECAVVPSVLIWVVLAVGTEQGGKVGATLFTLTGGTLFSMAVNNNAISGYRQWLYTASGRNVPSISLEHSGDGKTTSTPHLWVGFARSNAYMVKLGWTGSGWNGPSGAVQVNPTALSSQDYLAARWDGSRFIAVAPDPTSTSTVVVLERNKANSTTTVRNTPTHPTGVITSVGLGWNTISGDLRVFATGTSTAVLYYVDFTRQSSSWGAWAQVTATAIVGSPPSKWNVRQGSSGPPTRYDVVTCHFGTPNTVVNTVLGLNYPPDAPTWDTAAMGLNSGAAADVSATRLLDWVFNDPNASDAQSAYALSRQIGAGALNYWRASDSTWQVAEVKNTSGTSAITLAAAWAAASDAAYTFRVKVWDVPDVASVYSDGFVIVPSAKVNPTITAPAAAGTITTSQVTATWTVSEQTQFRVTLATNPAGLLVWDSGWVASATLSYTVPVDLADLSGWTLSLQTTNLEGLPSNVVTVNFTVDMVEPAAPTLVATAQPTNGVVSVAITNPTPVGTQPALSTQDLYRRAFLYAVLNSNPFFEAGTTDWTGVNATISQSGTQFHEGIKSLRLVPVSGAACTAETGFYTIDPTLPYQGECWMRFDTANKPGTVQLQWYDVASSLLSTTAAVIQAVAGAWIYAVVSLNSPPTNATKLKLAAGVTGTPAAGDAVYIDEIKLRRYNPDPGVRVAAALASAATYGDWGATSGTEYEYRVLAHASTGTAIYGPWTQ